MEAHSLQPVHSRSARVSPQGSVSSSIDEELNSLTASEGLVSVVSLRFLSPRVEALYLSHVGGDRSTFADVLLYLLLSALALAAFVTGLLLPEAGLAPLVVPALVALGTWAAVALLMLVAHCVPISVCTAPIGPISIAAGLLELMVPVVVALLCWHEEDGVQAAGLGANGTLSAGTPAPPPHHNTAATSVVRHATTAQAVLLCLACLPGAVLTVPLKWAAPPMLAASVAFCVVLLVDATLPRSELVTRVVSTLLVAFLVVMSHRRHELLFRLQFFRAVEEDMAANSGAKGLGGSRSRVSATSASPFRRSFTKADTHSGANRTITPSTDMVEALSQLRLLQAAPNASGSWGGSRRGNALNKRINKTIELLEASIVTAPVGSTTSSNFDWQHEIAAAGVDDTVGEWLMSTLASAQQRSGSSTLGGGTGTYTTADTDSFSKLPAGAASTSPTPAGGSFTPGVLHRAMSDLSMTMGRRSEEEAPEPVRDRRGSETKTTLNESIGATLGKVASPFRSSSRTLSSKAEAEASSFAASRGRRSSEEHDDPTMIGSMSAANLMEMEIARITPKGKPLAEAALRDWGADVIEINRATEGHALYFIAMAVLERHNLINACRIDRTTLSAFLLRIERKYGNNEYHNSMHGCDVMLHTHLFLTRFGFVNRMSHIQLLAAFIGALIHDFNHPVRPLPAPSSSTHTHIGLIRLPHTRA